MKSTHQKLEPSALRQEAEKLINNKKPSKTYSEFSEIERLEFIHELEVHQIELELQNEELVQTRASAQEAAEKYTELYDFAPLGYLTLTDKGIIKELNYCAAQMLGKDRWGLIDRPLAFFITTDTRLRFSDFLDRLFKTNAKESCEITISSPGNMPVYVHISGVASRKGDECLINVMDITERKQAEKAIMENQRLNVIGELASSVGHDFKNALQSISGNLEIAMLNPDVPEAAMEYLRAVRTAVDDAAARVRLLQRFDGKNQEKAQYTSIDLNSLFCEVVAQLRPLWKDAAEKNGLAITIETSLGDIPQISGNKEELRTVLYNILKNGIEAMPRGGRIFIETGKRPDGVFVTISDNGIGMNEETQHKIFQPFYSTKGFDIGRGLGMSGAFTIIKEHKGNIQVKNTAPGEGTSIEIVLPCSEETQDAEKKKTERKARNFKGTLRILWVEDEDSVGKLLKEMVTLLGHEMDLADNGIEALEYLDQKTYDLVITDISMPGMNGWQLAEIIKEKFEGQIKVVIASGWGDQVSDAQKIEYGISYIIDKPFGMDKLGKLLKEIEPGKRE